MGRAELENLGPLKTPRDAEPGKTLTMTRMSNTHWELIKQKFQNADEKYQSDGQDVRNTDSGYPFNSVANALRDANLHDKTSVVLDTESSRYHLAVHPNYHIGVQLPESEFGYVHFRIEKKSKEAARIDTILKAIQNLI